MVHKPSIVFAVTVSTSLKLLGNIPHHMRLTGWDVHVVCSEGDELREFSRLGFNVHPLPMNRGLSVFQDIQAMARWLKILRIIRPAVVTAGTPKAALLAMLAARATGVRHRVYVLRGLRLEGAGGLLAVILRLSEALTSWSSSRVIAVSPSLRATYLARGLVRPSKIEVLGRGSSHGVDLQRFLPRTAEASSYSVPVLEDARATGKLVVGFVGRFCADKGAAVLLACKQQLFREGIDHEFVIMGRVEDSAEILEQMNAFGQPVVKLPDLDDSSSVYKYLSILLLPTAREGFPNVVLEAGAAGVPVITTDATGAVDSVVHRKTGLVVRNSDVAGFLHALIELAREPKLRLKLGAAAQKFVSANYDAVIVSKTWETFFNGLVGVK